MIMRRRRWRKYKSVQLDQIMPVCSSHLIPMLIIVSVMQNVHQNDDSEVVFIPL